MEPADKPPGHRAIRSYVLRGGRITHAQQHALERLWPACGVDFSPQPLDLDALFGRAAVPRTLEIGFGNGAHLLARALADPGRDFVGIEVHRAGIGHLLLAAERAGLKNLRLIAHDAAEVVARQLPEGSFTEIQVLFPDPWPKKRHHKRRLLQPAFVALLASRLRPAGTMHFATDWEPYALAMHAALSSCALLRNTAPDGLWSPRPDYRAATRFEARGTRLGHPVRDLIWERRNTG